MDEPDLDPELHRAALDGLRRLNQWSRSAAILWPRLRQVAGQAGARLRVADLACGGGDVTLALAARAKSRGLPLQFDAFDRSPVAIEYARQRAAQLRVEQVHFAVADVFTVQATVRYDAVICSLFLHHLKEDEAVQLLMRMREMSTRCVLVNDLRRTRWGALWVRFGCRLLTRSPVVHVDGPLSARAAFSIAELGQLASRAGLAGYRITAHRPQRMLLDWRPA